MSQEPLPPSAANANVVGMAAIGHFVAEAPNSRRALVAHAAAVLAMHRRGGSLIAIAKAFSTTLGREISKKQVETILHSIKTKRISVSEAEVGALEACILNQLSSSDEAKPSTKEKSVRTTPVKSVTKGSKAVGKAALEKTAAKPKPKAKAKPKPKPKAKAPKPKVSKKSPAPPPSPQATFSFGL